VDIVNKPLGMEATAQTVSACGITGDPDLDDILDRASVFGNNPVAESAKRFMQLIPPPPVLEVDEDEYNRITSNSGNDDEIASWAKAAIGVGIAAAVGAGILICNAVKNNL
jgi:hypothetical protein